MNNLDYYITCPITGLIFIDPVKATDGYTYERSAIMEWFKNHNTSPMSGMIINNKTLIDDFSMKSIVTKYNYENDNKHKIEKQIVFQNIEPNIQNMYKYNKFQLTKIVSNKKSLMEYISTIHNFDIFKHVVMHSIDTFDHDQYGHYLIHYVCKNASILEVEYLKNNGHNIECLTKNTEYSPEKGKSPLHFACENNNDINNQIALYLINNNVNTNIMEELSSTRATPLYYAILNKKLNIVDILWENNNKFTYRNDHAIHLMAEHIPNEIIPKIKTTTNLFVRNSKTETFVHVLFEHAELSIIFDVLQYLFNDIYLKKYIDDIDVERSSPIFNLTNRFPDNFELWSFLIKNNFNMYRKNYGVNDICNLISQTSNKDIMNMILQYIKRNNCHTSRGHYGYTPIHYIIMTKNDWLIMEYFKFIGYDSLLSDNNDNIISYIIRYTPHLTEYVLDYVTDINTPNKQGIYAIHQLIRHIGTDLLDKFVQKGANVNVKTNFGKSVFSLILEKALSSNDIQIIDDFIKKYNVTDLNIQYNDGYCPFHENLGYYIVHNRLYKFIDYLISKGVNLKFKGQFNLVYNIISKDIEPTDNIKQIINLITLDGIDFNLPIMVNNTKYTVNDRLDYYLGVWYY